MVVFTWGAGGTYSTLVAALNALPNPLADNYRLLQVGSSTENAAYNANINHAGYYVEITSNMRHYGNPTLGHLCSVNPGTSIWLLLNTSLTAHKNHIIIHGLRMIRTSVAGSGLNNATFINFVFAPFNSECKYIAYDNIIDGNGINDRAFGISSNTVAPGHVRIYQNKIFGNRYRQIDISGAGTIPEVMIENNIIDGQNIVGAGSQEGFLFNSNTIAATLTLKNNAIVRHNINDIRFIAGTPLLRVSNATSDATGDAGLRNKVPADEFESLVDTEDDFLFLKQGSIDLSASRSPSGNLATKQKCLFTPSLSFNPSTCTIGIAGVVPTYAGVLDIADKARPGGDDLYSIGCHEQQYV